MFYNLFSQSRAYILILWEFLLFLVFKFYQIYFKNSEMYQYFSYALCFLVLILETFFFLKSY